MAFFLAALSLALRREQRERADHLDRMEQPVAMLSKEEE
jgi:hypothetical protein